MKYFSSFVLTLLITTNLFGQQNGIEIGIQGSPSLIFLRGNEFIEKYHNKTIGFSTGVFFQRNLPKTFSVRSELQFERKGSIFYGHLILPDGSSKYVTSRINFNYVTSTVLVRANWGKATRFFINAGVFGGYLIKQTSIAKLSSPPSWVEPVSLQEVPIEFNINKPFDGTKYDKREDLGAVAGAGISVPVLSRFLISLEIRENLGLINVSKVPVINDGTIKTSSTNLMIGVAYHL